MVWNSILLLMSSGCFSDFFPFRQNISVKIMYRRVVPLSTITPNFHLLQVESLTSFILDRTHLLKACTPLSTITPNFHHLQVEFPEASLVWWVGWPAIGFCRFSPPMERLIYTSHPTTHSSFRLLLCRNLVFLPGPLKATSGFFGQLVCFCRLSLYH